MRKLLLRSSIVRALSDFAQAEPLDIGGCGSTPQRGALLCLLAKGDVNNVPGDALTSSVPPSTERDNAVEGWSD